MINKLIISVNAYVQLQGNEVLRLEDMNREAITYQLVGFEDRPIIIQDYRPYGVDALQALLADGRSRDFRTRFNQPSNVLLFTGTQGEVMVQLMEAAVCDPLYILWIAAGAEETVPLGCASLFRDVRRQANQRRAFMSLHKHPHRAPFPVDRRLTTEPILHQAQTLKMEPAGR